MTHEECPGPTMYMDCQQAPWWDGWCYWHRKVAQGLAEPTFRIARESR